MAIIKCKMCGGDLELLEDSSVCECEYCGTKQTVPKVDDEKKLKLFERANRLRTACEFDKAAGVYETIIADFDQEAEAYWGLILCKFGIEYVDDPATGKKIPTCHRSSFESLMDDPNFEMVMECADPIARRVYRDEAKQIEELRKNIIEVSSREEPYDVFISYKELAEDGQRTLDSVIAQDIYTELTDKGYRVFFSRISLEDKLGVEYEPYIFAALNSAKVMLVVGTDYDYFNAVWVKNEWSRFLALMAKGEKKVLIPVFKGIDAYDMPKEFNKLAAQDMGKVGAMQDLIRGVEKILGKKQAEPAQPQIVQQVVQGGANLEALLKRGFMSLEDAQWGKATELFDKVLNDDPENAQAYLGLAMAEAQKQTRSAYAAAYTAADSKLRGSRYAARARQFDAELEKWFADLDKEGKRATIQANLEEAKRAFPDCFTVQDGVLKRKPGAEWTLPVAIIPEGVTCIGEEAFCNCKALTDIALPESVTSIGDYAFSGCEALTSITLPESVTSISDTAFIGCKGLANEDGFILIRSTLCDYVGSGGKVTIPESVTRIGDTAFYDCEALTDISIPESVISIGERAFSGCKGLANAEGFVIIRNTLYCYAGSSGKVTVPEGVKNISGAFNGCKTLTGVTLPKSLTSIGCAAFSDCKALTSIMIPEGITKIGEESFWGCEALTSITLPKSLTSIGCAAFSFCKALTSITIPEGVTGIGEKIFWSCEALTSITIPEGVTGIGDYAFAGCEALTSIMIPESVLSIGKGAFSGIGYRGTIHAVPGSCAEQYAKAEQISFQPIKSRAELAAEEAARKAALEKAEAERKAKVAALNGEKAQLQVEHANLKGLFTGKRRKEIEARLAEIEAELKTLG